MNAATLGGLIRHLLTFGGGALGLNGYVGEGDYELAAGALATMIGFVWSILEKRRRI